MGCALSEDLRWRIVYLNSDGYNEREISNLLHMSQSTVNKVLNIYKHWACVVNPLKKIPGRKKLFTRNEMDILKSLVQNKVDWYLDELVFEMETYTNKKVSVPTLWRTLKYIGITRKKLHKAAKERNELVRANFIATIGEGYKSEQLIFIDESAKDERSLSRFYGYAPVNTRAQKKVVFVRGKRYTLLPALSLDGFIAMDIFEGSCDRNKFSNFILNQLLQVMNPYPGKHSVIIMDNARIHHDTELIETIKALGCRIIFLPPYSPDYNPIETAFSTIKLWIKRNQIFMESCNDPIYALHAACAQITTEMAKSFFTSSIYCNM